MVRQNSYEEVHHKMDLLLKAHGVDFDDSHQDKESVESLHEKADALLTAHKLEIPTGEISKASLQPKLDLLIEGHGKEFDDSNLDPVSLDTAVQKLDVLNEAHGV